MADDMMKLLETALQDTYSAETQILEALPKMEQAATSPALKQAFREHLTQTERQVERLQQAAKMLKVEPEGETCEAMEGHIEEGEELIDEFDQGPVLDAALIGAAQKVEHYEIAAYGTICAMLKAMGEQKAAELLGQTLQEEKDTDERLTMLAEQEVNPAAIGQGRAANDPSGRSRGAA
jgi:ferritin-like metal-binding protein YciE